MSRNSSFLSKIRTFRSSAGKRKKHDPDYSPTAYDDAFRTLLNDCPELLFPLLNEMFGEQYSGMERIEFTPNEHFLNQQDGSSQKRITDTSFQIIGKTTKHYHLECQSTEDHRLLIRIFEYDAQIALDQNSEIDGNQIIIRFPHTGILFLRSTSSTADTMRITLQTSEGETGYEVPVLKIRDYSMDEIFEKKLLFLIPFYLFIYEEQLPELNSNAGKRKDLRAEYVQIQMRLEKMVKTGLLEEFTRKAIMENCAHVMNLLAWDYEDVRKEMKTVMVGKVLDYEAKRIRDAAWNQALAVGTRNGETIGESRGIAIGESRGEKRGIAIGESRGRVLQSIEIYRTEMNLDDHQILKKITEKFSLDESEAKQYMDDSRTA